MSDFIFLGSKITADGDCSHEIKRFLLPGRKVILRMRPVSRGYSRHSHVDGDTCQKTPISRFALDKIPMPGHLFEDNPFDEGTTRRGTVALGVLGVGTEGSCLRCSCSAVL